MFCYKISIKLKQGITFIVEHPMNILNKPGAAGGFSFRLHEEASFLYYCLHGLAGLLPGDAAGARLQVVAVAVLEEHAEAVQALVRPPLALGLCRAPRHALVGRGGHAVPECRAHALALHEALQVGARGRPAHAVAAAEAQQRAVGVRAAESVVRVVSEEQAA